MKRSATFWKAPVSAIPAAIDKTPETSKYTSIKKRISKAKTVATPNHAKQQIIDAVGSDST